MCTSLIAVGVNWDLLLLALFIRDVSAVTSPLPLMLMIIYPIFYPASAVPERIKWAMQLNPLANIIDPARASVPYGDWPWPGLALRDLAISGRIAVAGYFPFMRSKSAFADAI